MKVIQASYLMPHPPIMIPEIGKGEEIKLYQTFLSCLKVGEEISKLCPDTIVLVTPHGAMFSDAMAISDADRMSGSLKQFNCHQVEMVFELDTDFNQVLIENCQNGVPVIPVDEQILKVYNRSFELDHGTIVPLYFINQYYQNYKLVHLTYAPLSDRELYQFGMKIKEAAEKLNRKVVIIASGDLSHKLNENSPYLYSPAGEEFDRQLLTHLSVGEPLNIFEIDRGLISEAAECGLRSIKILLGVLDGYRVKGEVLSYQAPFGVGYAVVKFKVHGPGIKALKYIGRSDIKTQNFIQKGNPYVQLAKKALEDYFNDTKTMVDREDLPSEMITKRQGVFVSLKRAGKLRGCIGTIFPVTDCIASEIIRNAILAATQDPRFYAVTKSELNELTISVDVLSTPTYATREALDPKRYGVIVSKDERRGVLLPDLVGVETVDDQLKIACQKAGIMTDESFIIEKFEVIRYQEEN